jgi:murein DD-endopeptidase MepM/ murein hydrolase activator NlpD
MASERRGINGLLSALFPEKRLFIHSGDATHYIRLSPLSQLVSGSAALLAMGWMAVASATVATDLVKSRLGPAPSVVIEEAYQDRLNALARERDQRAVEARSAQERFQVAMEQISRQQSAILESVEERRELSTTLELMRQRLREAVGQRDAASGANDRLVAEMQETAKSLEGEDGGDLADTLRTVSGALSEAVQQRDAANAERAALAQQLGDTELRMKMSERRQDEMVDEVEQAVAMSFGPLEKVFKAVDLDVDGLIDKVRGAYSGVGGPVGPVAVSTRSFDDPALSGRYNRLMGDLDRMNLMRIAADKLPLALPLHDDFRFTSAFGYRHDPKGRGNRMHAGVDLAGPRGTPIYATAQGVVVYAGPESGYGNVVRIQHDFGFETVYAHQSRIRVKVGQQVSRGVQIGDMGSTGRSTGSHLHYEVRVNGQPVNPMTYLEAAKDVF